MIADLDAARAQAVEEVIVTATRRGHCVARRADCDPGLYRGAGRARQHHAAGRFHRADAETPTSTRRSTPGEADVSIRGIQGNFQLTQPVAIVIDGVVAANSTALDQELFNIQQIEVVKGPQGALYGRNANAGAIIINTVAPTNDFHGKVLIGGGNGGSSRAQAVLSGPDHRRQAAGAHRHVGNRSRRFLERFRDRTSARPATRARRGRPPDLERQRSVDARLSRPCQRLQGQDRLLHRCDRQGVRAGGRRPVQRQQLLPRFTRPMSARPIRRSASRPRSRPTTSCPTGR